MQELRENTHEKFLVIIVTGRRNVDTHPLEVFLYAQKHGYTKLADKAAPLTLKFSAEEMYAQVKKSGAMETFIKWVSHDPSPIFFPFH